LAECYGLNLPLPKSVKTPLFDIAIGQFTFDLFSVMNCFLEYRLSEHNKISDSKSDTDYEQFISPKFNAYFELLIRALKSKGKLPAHFKPLSPWPNNAPFALGLSHDIDILKRKIPGSVKILLKSITSKDIPGGVKGSIRGLADATISSLTGKTNPYQHFDKYLEKVTDCTFFVFAGKRLSPKDPTYTHGISGKMLSLWDSVVLEIALHNGIGSWRNKAELAVAKAMLEELIQPNIKGIRPHYLDCKFPDFWNNASFFDYSSTVGSDKIPGFTAGLNFPFWGFNFDTGEKINILEMPIGLMDCALFAIKDENRRQQALDNIIDACIANHGLLVIDWHNTSIYEPDYPGWFESYNYIIQKAKDNHAFMASLGKISDHWRNHCASVFLS
jgi:hypothetical protein